MPKITLEELQAHAEEEYQAAKGNAAAQAPWALVLAMALYLALINAYTIGKSGK